MTRFAITAAVLAWLASSAPAETVKITVEEPSGVKREGWPVTSGMPFAQGALADPDATALFDADGNELPLQTEVLARWPDGSVRWLLLDFQVDLAASQTRAFTVRFGPDVRRRPVDKPVQVEQKEGAVVMNTGRLQIVLSAEEFRLLDAVWLDSDKDGTFSDDERVAGPGGAGIILKTPDGKAYRADLAKAEMTVEQAGPMRACVRVTGRHGSDDGTMFRYVVRLHAFRGQRLVRLFYTFINDHQDAVMAKIDSIELGFPVWAYPIHHEREAERPVDRVFQRDESHFLDHRGRPRKGRASGGQEIDLLMEGPAGLPAGLHVAVRQFWQNWPKSLGWHANSIGVGICPDFERGLYDGKPLAEESKLYYYLRDGCYTFKCGVARTHELWAEFAGPSGALSESKHFRAATEDPLLATCEPAYVSQTKAAGEFPPADPEKYCGYDAWLDRALDAHLARRDKLREYGMLNFGDWYGERSVNWGNLEYDLAHGLFLQYLRTGDRKFFLRAEEAARHHIDVDVVHATNPHMKNPWGAPPRVGDIWLHCVGHTGGYYEDAPLPVSRTYQMGHSTNFGHVWVSGDLDYYYLTGDRRALEVSLQLADAMTSHVPTRYGTHIRALGWPMILVLAAYDATGDPKYLEAAEKNWQVLKENIDWDRGWVVRLAGDHCKHGDRRCLGNVPFMEGLTLCALVRYHRITGDPEVLRAITVGIDQMIRECWEEDVGTFRYTACPLSSKTPYVLFVLSAEAMAYEAALTGNEEHLRILRKGFRSAVPRGSGLEVGKGLAQMIFFAPHGLSALEE